jgi:hypothetical protein
MLSEVLSKTVGVGPHCWLTNLTVVAGVDCQYVL